MVLKNGGVLDFHTKCQHIISMQWIVHYAFLFCVLGATGCFASKSADQSQQSGNDSTAVAAFPEIHHAPNAVQQNISSVEAVVDSVFLIDEQQYKVSVLIRSLLLPEGGFASPGEHLTLTPQFVLTDSSAVDMSNPKNLSLLSVRSLKKGNSFKGKISLNQQRSWILYEILNQ